MTKRLLVGAACAVTALAAPMAASAQSWGDRDRDGRYERWERRADDNRRDGGRYTRQERYNDHRRGVRDQRRDYRRWQRGAVIPQGYRSTWYVRDYNRYGYGPPPRGYGYYRTNTGEVVMAAIATGLIVSLLTN
jgi:Ni/Co efflux regulator RcnB